MIFILFIVAALTIFYALLMLNYFFAWKKLPQIILEKNILVQTSVSVIIPARNEEANISKVLQAILQQNFPKDLLQLIVVDDHSTDNTSAIAIKILEAQKQTGWKVLSLADTGKIEMAYKKKAIEYAIQQATGKCIITTDADCVMQSDWLINLVAHYEKTNCKMIAAPVKFSFNDSFFQKFQALDFIGLIGITGASIQQHFYNMCNGANLLYERNAFFKVNGFKGNDNLSSGDDMFLMHKIAEKFPNQISFLKTNDACVITHPKETLNEFIQQRLRWTSKSTSYSDKRITLILIVAYLFNVSIVLNFLCGFFQFHFLEIALLQLLLKSIVEFLFLKNVTDFFQQKKLLAIFIPAQLLHIFYVIAVGLAGQFGNFNWKGRENLK